MKSLVTYSRQVAVAFMFLLAFLATSVVEAQDSSVPDNQQATVSAEAPQAVVPSALSVGIRGQAARTEFYGGSVGDAQSNMTLGAAAFLKVKRGERFAVQPEVVYTRSSGRVDHSRAIQSAKDARYNLSHLKVPFLLKAYLDEVDGRSFHATAGPFARVRLSQDARSEYHRGLTGDTIDEMLRSWDYGLDLGVGMETFGAAGALYIDLRYELGLTNLFAESDRPDFRTRGLVLSIGVST